jgi:mono/diheme cytochrome c family protein
MKTLPFRIAGSILLLCSIAGAQDAAALYRSRCASCHGASGEGKPAIKDSSLITGTVKAKSDAELEDYTLNGGGKASHAFARRGVTPEQAKALVAYIRGLQK